MNLKEKLILLKQNKRNKKLEEQEITIKQLEEEEKIITIFLKQLNEAVDNALQDGYDYIHIFHDYRLAPIITKLGFNWTDHWADITDIPLTKKNLKLLMKLLKIYSYNKNNITEEDEDEFDYIIEIGGK